MGSNTLYTKTICHNCLAAKSRLDAYGIGYDVVNVEEDAEAFEYLKSQGAQAVPVFKSADGELFVGVTGVLRFIKSL